ncbi:excinuclease ABC subunit UvrA [Breznakiella homolactica]|uniref:UvrABC system protein A n=1 Tax=Breznakiella homolactica TaxID=2798577 RepID=A0A7T8B8Q0_9SPIR|nr:excinuclease ABC subunit UvrA [Breznakiella homolactica]QQO08839.1 excinuclease ABC subunit UvrA [Breznakiella homolactica]
MEEKAIVIVGARQNNLKNLSLRIPKNRITVFTGVSGSGKSSLVFETIGAEAQRQINETQSGFARNRLVHMGAAEVDSIENLNVPVIINQKRLGGNARSTVGTATDIYTHLRLLFSRVGRPFAGFSHVFSFNHPQGMCPRCEGLGYIQTISTERLIDREKSLNEGAIRFPTFQPGGWRLTRYTKSGYFDNERKLKDFTPEEWNTLLYAEEHKPKKPDSDWGKTVLYEGLFPRIEKAFLKKDSREHAQRKKLLKEIIIKEICPECGGKRLNKKVLSCRINGMNIADCAALPADELLAFAETIDSGPFESVAAELRRKLEHLVAIGLSYLSLDRETGTLSGGESQRIKMVKHLGSSLVDLLYIFDEPSIGLHPKDIHHIAEIITRIRDKGNTVLIVEHDPDLIRLADHVVDMGPSSGRNGGEIVYQGSFSGLARSAGKTGGYFSRSRGYNRTPREPRGFLEIKHAGLYNLRDLTVKIPREVFAAVTGVAGSGKSTLISRVMPLQYPEAVIIDQGAFTGTVRGTLLTYLGLLGDIRDLFARVNRVSPGLFSRNSGGACPSCRGLGMERLDLAFMGDIETICEVCGGTGFNPEVLKYEFNRRNIAQVMDLTVSEARDFFREDFSGDSVFMEKLNLLHRLGLDYLTLGQRLDSFSGGERQRLKLSKRLDSTGRLLVLDEPSTGLHSADTEKLMAVLNGLVDQGNTLIVIEHNLDIISRADWIIDLGPGAGRNGGKIVFEGTAEELLECKSSETGRYLRKHLAS